MNIKMICGAVTNVPGTKTTEINASESQIKHYLEKYFPSTVLRGAIESKKALQL